jgi:tol-pal system protein YbgF
VRCLYAYCGWMGVFWAFLVVTLPGCTSSQTKQDYRMAALQGDLYRIAKSNKATQTEIHDAMGRLDAMETKIDALESRVEEVRSAPKQDLSRETGSEETAGESLEEISGWLHALDARVRGLQRAVEELPSRPEPSATSMKMEPALSKESPSEKTAPAVAVKKKTAVVDDLVQHEYEKAYTAYVEHRYDEALTLFEDFLKRYPEHELAGNAQYWFGETYYDLGDYASAILTFKDVLTRYADHAKAPDALLKIGYAYIALDDPSNARMFLKRLIKNYPLSDAEPKARAQLKGLDRQ